MKKFLVLFSTLFAFTLNACSQPSQPEPPVVEITDEYKEDVLYQKLLEIETCTDYEILLPIIDELYNEKFIAVIVEYGEDGYKRPYEDAKSMVSAVYDTSKKKETVTSTTVLFFPPMSEVPYFMMDVDGTYIVDEYIVENYEDGTHEHVVSGYVLSDLYVAYHGYVEGDDSVKSELKTAASEIESYLILEQAIQNLLAE